jgi:hypothetical protein
LILRPDQYTSVSTYELLSAAEQGFVGLDHRFLHAIVDDPERSIPDLLRFGLEQRPNPRDNLTEDLVQIFRHLRTPNAIPFLVEYFRRNHQDATIPVICAFRDIGAAAVEPLLKLYEQVKEDENSDAGFLLSSLGVRDPRILQALVDRLKIDPVDAGHCLIAYGDPAAIPAVREACEQVKNEEWMTRSLAFCVQQLEAGPATQEDEPFDLWELYPAETDPRFDLLTEQETELFLDSSDRDNRFAAVSVLSEQTTPKRLWDKLLWMAREDPDMTIRGECWQALMDGWERADIRKAMRDCLANENASAEERSGALRSLTGREGEKPEIQSWMIAFYEQPAMRAAGLQAMAISQDPRFGEYFSKRLGDPDAQVCAQAILGIALLEMEQEAPRLVPFFNDDALRTEALAAYAMCAAAEPSRAGLRRLLKKIDELSAGLSADEETLVKDSLNSRAERGGLEPIWNSDGEIIADGPVVATVKVGRNDPCPCGSGRKYKKCCGK